MTQEIKRLSGGHYAKGSSGNRSGRPNGWAGMARAIQAETRDGAELREFALEVFRNKAGLYALSDRFRAFEWLSDRGWGKAVTMVDLQAVVASAPLAADVDATAIEAMPRDEFDAARATLRKLTAASRQLRGERDAPIDAASVEKK